MSWVAALPRRRRRASCTPAQVTVTAHGDPFGTFCDLVAADPAAMIVVEMMAEPDVRAIMASPLVGIGSDNGPPMGLQHPRTYGYFPWLLGTYVRLGVRATPKVS